MSGKAIGTLLVSISGICFGTYGYFALKANAAGMGPFSLLMYRFGIAAIVLAIVAFATRSRFNRPGEFWALFGLAGLYVGQAFTFMQCLVVSQSPIVASLLLYLYPAFVTVGSVLFLHEKLTRVKVIALVCAFAGSFLIIGPVGNVPPIAVFYGVFTAVFYAAYLVRGKKVIGEANPVMATLVILSTSAVVFGIGALATGVQTPHTPSEWVAPVALAIVATVVAIGTLLAGLSRVSPVEAASLSALEPLVSAIIAITVMGQPLRVWHVAGGALVIAAVIVLARASVAASPQTGPM